MRDFTKLVDDDIVLARRFLGIAIEGSLPPGRGAGVYLQELIGHPSITSFARSLIARPDYDRQGFIVMYTASTLAESGMHRIYNPPTVMLCKML
jgi:hypothetical protein